MTSQEFIIWLKGFTEGVHEFNVTPKQWDLLKERLAEVDDESFVETPGMFQVHPQPWYPYPGTSIGPYGTGTPNHDLVHRGEVSIPSIWTTTSGSNVNFTITSGSSYSGAATYLYPNGTNVTYTNGNLNIKDTSPSDTLDVNNKTLLND